VGVTRHGHVLLFSGAWFNSLRRAGKDAQEVEIKGVVFIFRERLKETKAYAKPFT